MNKINFLGYRKICGLISLLLVVASLLYITAFGVKRNVDFEGGTKLTVKFQRADVNIGDLRERVSQFEPKASIVKINSSSSASGPLGSIFSLKVKKPDVEKGQEAEASLARLQGLEKAFGSLAGDEQNLLELLKKTNSGVLAKKLIADNPLNLTGTDSEKTATYQQLAGQLMGAMAQAGSLEEITAVSPENSQVLVAWLHVAFPDLNHTTPDLLNALLKRYDPLNRGLDGEYGDIVSKTTELREANGDFITDFETFFQNLQVADGESLDQLKAFFSNNFTLGSYKVISNETFSPSIAAELLSDAWGAIILALIGILLYIAMRFNRGYAVASVVALAHDVIIALGIFAISGAELSNPVVAAFLTIVGYSLNDTIVVFDRIRDNLGDVRQPKLIEIMNTSINQTLSRTLVTSLTTLFVVAVIYWFSYNATLKDFSFPLLIGIVVGTYSSIFVASPMLNIWHEKVKSVAG